MSAVSGRNQMAGKLVWFEVGDSPSLQVSRETNVPAQQREREQPHLFTPECDRDHLPGHVHQVQRALGHLTARFGGDTGDLIHAAAHADHVCKSRGHKVNYTQETQ